MSGDAIREAMARGICASPPFSGEACALLCYHCTSAADAALAALPVTAAQLAEIAAGRAVVVPVEATEGMVRAAQRLDFTEQHDPTWPEFYRVMIAAAPREGEP